MDIQLLSQIISSVGFPIVVACAMFWYINEQRQSHQEETKELQKSIERNTEILSELKGVIETLSGIKK